MKKRLFFALPISESFRESIVKVINICDNEIRWVSKDNYHVTLLFLGETPAGRIEEIIKHSEVIAATHNAFSLHSYEISIQGKKDRRMVWVKFETCSAFSGLNNKLSQSLNCELVREQTPHITLARLKNNRSALTGFKVNFEEILKVDQFELWESVAGPEGVKYYSIGTFNLQTGN